MKKAKLLMSFLVLGLAITGAVLYQGDRVKAGEENRNGRSEEMAEKLAAKLNIDQNQVQGAFNQIREERQEARQAEINTNLDKAVADGVITPEQKQKIVEKKTEIRSSQEKKRGEMRTWTEQNNIDFDKLKDYEVLGFGKGKGMGGGGNHDCCK